MATVHDVARYILETLAPDQFGERITGWKLQKLVYYAQAWSLVWDERPIFEEDIQAWANGPVCPALYAQHQGKLRLHAGDIEGNPAALNVDERDTIDSVINYYGHRSGTWLSDLTHLEKPWRRARRGLDDGEPSQNVISQESMAEYYESIEPGE